MAIDNSIALNRDWRKENDPGEASIALFPKHISGKRDMFDCASDRLGAAIAKGLE
jgi:hypothetical protein